MSIATIVPSEKAPSEAVTYNIAGVEFTLGGRVKKYETDNTALIAEVASQPWLTIKADPDAVNPVPDAPAEDSPQPVAIDAGLVQTEPVEEAGVAETLAADETSKTSKKRN